MMKRKPYYILLGGEWVGQTWAASEAEAKKNYWWKNVKGQDPFGARPLEPNDFEAVCAGR
jgi:hypothetical protein